MENHTIILKYKAKEPNKKTMLKKNKLKDPIQICK